MREYILEFKQKAMLRLGLNLSETLILDYLIKFFDSGNQLIKNIDGKKYAWITFDKVIEDLPILNIKERMWQTILSNLEKKKVIKRMQLDRKMFIYIDREKLYAEDLCVDYLTDDELNLLRNDGCKKLQDNCQNMQIHCANGCKKLHPIVNYYNKKIKIIIDDERVAFINSEKFLSLLKSKLKNSISALAFNICVKNMEVVLVSSNLIILSTVATDILKLNTNGEFDRCVCKTLLEILEEE